MASAAADGLACMSLHDSATTVVGADAGGSGSGKDVGEAVRGAAAARAPSGEVAAKAQQAKAVLGGEQQSYMRGAAAPVLSRAQRGVGRAAAPQRRSTGCCSRPPPARNAAQFLPLPPTRLTPPRLPRRAAAHGQPHAAGGVLRRPCSGG